MFIYDIVPPDKYMGISSFINFLNFNFFNFLTGVAHRVWTRCHYIQKDLDEASGA